MEAEEYIKHRFEHEVKVVDDLTEDIDWRFCVYFRHVGRLEGLFMVSAISLDRYSELMVEWNQHWPFRPILNRRKQ